MSQVYTVDSHIDSTGKGDPKRAEEQVKIGLKLRNLGYTCHDIGRVLREHENGDGLVEVVVYASTLKKIQADVEPAPHMIDVAKQTHSMKLRTYIAKSLNKPIDEIPADPSQWTAEQKNFDAVYPGSWEAEFTAMNGRGPKPLIEVRLLEDKLPMPVSSEDKTTMALIKAATGDGMMNALLLEKLNAMQAELDKLKKKSQ